MTSDIVFAYPFTHRCWITCSLVNTYFPKLLGAGTKSSLLYKQEITACQSEYCEEWTSKRLSHVPITYIHRYMMVNAISSSEESRDPLPHKSLLMASVFFSASIVHSFSYAYITDKLYSLLKWLDLHAVKLSDLWLHIITTQITICKPCCIQHKFVA